MSVLVYIEAEKGEVKKTSLEAISYGSKFAQSVSVLSTDELSQDVLATLGKYGATKVLHVQNEKLAKRPVAPIATAIAEASQKEGATTVVMPRSSLTDVLAPLVSIKLGATLASNVASLPDTSAGFVVKRGIFTGKAFADVSIKGDKKVLTIRKGATSIEEGGGTASVEVFAPNFGEKDFAVTIIKTEKQEGDILLPEADKVVSAGRGLKAGENWGMIEDLAKTLGAATACSKPVSDMDWRPHHEHVGQTGIKVSPDLYIAVGISGAIQHLAGVSSSKVLVVINKDADAPFFKAADYGIVGDAFDVVPKLNEAFKKVL